MGRKRHQEEIHSTRVYYSFGLGEHRPLSNRRSQGPSSRQLSCLTQLSVSLSFLDSPIHLCALEMTGKGLLYVMKGIQPCCRESFRHRLFVFLQNIYTSPRAKFSPGTLLKWILIVPLPSMILVSPSGRQRVEQRQWEPQRVLVGHMEHACLRFSLSVVQVLLQVEGHEGLGDAIAFQHWALGSVHGCHGRGTAGQGTAALIDVGIGVLDDCTVGTLHGHSYVMDLALLTAGALMLHGLDLQGVPVDMGGQRFLSMVLLTV